MTISTSTKTVILEREMPQPAEKIWRALTEGQLIEQWLMKNDFEPVVGHRFQLSADWGSVDCEVLAVEPGNTLAYTWVAYGLETVVTWTLTPIEGGTRVRMEQAGFRSAEDAAYKGATYGWRKFVDELERVAGWVEG